jgi:ubiquinol-cytochrome c reductase cytochrome c subunit
MMKVCNAVAAAVLVVCSVSAASAQDAPAGNTKAGQQVYKAVGCWQCHGTVGQGGAITGPRLAATALPYAAFLQQLRVPANAMPAYEPKILSNADATNIYAWLKSIPAPKSPQDIPLLSNN